LVAVRHLNGPARPSRQPPVLLRGESIRISASSSDARRIVRSSGLVLMRGTFCPPARWTRASKRSCPSIVPPGACGGVPPQSNASDSNHATFTALSGVDCTLWLSKMTAIGCGSAWAACQSAAPGQRPCHACYPARAPATVASGAGAPMIACCPTGLPVPFAGPFAGICRWFCRRFRGHGDPRGAD
jgi:hypothetical protein